MTPAQRNRLRDLAEEVRQNVDSYYDMWRQPIKYRDLIPRMTVRLPEGVNLADFKDILVKGRYCTFMLSPRNRQYIYPASIARDDDTVLEQLIELDRIGLAIVRSTDRKRKKVSDDRNS